MYKFELDHSAAEADEMGDERKFRPRRHPGQINMSSPQDILKELGNLYKQATVERSHFYVAACCKDAIAEITRLRSENTALAAEVESANLAAKDANNYLKAGLRTVDAIVADLQIIAKERDALAASNRQLLAGLQSIVDGAVHPDTAIRRVMLDLAPIRALLAAHQPPAPGDGKI